MIDLKHISHILSNTESINHSLSADVQLDPVVTNQEALLMRNN